MARPLEDRMGRFSHALYNEKLNELYEIIKDINNQEASTSTGPDTEKQGALWLNMRDNGELKYRENGEWKNIFNDKFRLTSEMLFTEEPKDPVQGQLWIRDDVLVYRKDSYWVPIKAVNIATDFNQSVYEPFLLVGPMKPSGNLVVESGGITNPALKSLYKQEEISVRTGEYNVPISLRAGTYTPNKGCIFAYINGARVPSDKLMEVNHNTVMLKVAPETIGYEVVEPAADVVDYTLYLEYINLSDAQKVLDLHTEKSDVNLLTEDLSNPIYYSQFLVPSEEMDRIFVEGLHVDDDNYQVISNVAIQYPTEQIQGKTAMAVHVNPTKLTDIKKRVFLVDKNDPLIPVQERNTEFYGLRGGVGKLLIKSNDSNTDYRTTTGGIRLSNEAAEAYDFVMTHTYEFTNVKHVGSHTKQKTYLGEDSAIHIGQVDDPICVFTQGIYLDEHIDNYEYDYEKGYLKIKDIEGRTDIGVIAFYKKEIGTIIKTDSSGNGLIDVAKTYNDKMVFVYGVGLSTALADYEVNPSNPNQLIVKNAGIGMKYAIVELNSGEDRNMVYLSGESLEDENTGDSYIPMPDVDAISGWDQAIIFVNGLLVKRRDVDVDNTYNRIYVPNLKPGMPYVVLKDLEGRYIYSGDVSYNTIALSKKCDSAIVYLQSMIIPDEKAITKGILPKYASRNELVVIGNQWYKYDGTWKEIADPATQELANSLLNGYTYDEYSVSILKNAPGEKVNLITYQYANSVEEPILRGNVITKEGVTEYKVAFNHSFPLGRNCLSIWQNGLRQNPNTSYVPFKVFEDDMDLKSFELNGYQEKEGSRFVMPEGIDGGIFYVVERPEGSEYKSCERAVLTQADRLANSNVYYTELDLYGGILRVFVSGIRQTDKDYEVVDSHHIRFFESHCDEPDMHQDTVLIEVREDYKIREMTVEARFDGQWQYDTVDPKSPNGGDGLLSELIYSADFIMIYINGLAYGANYKVENEKVLLLDSYIKEIIKVGDKITFEWR